MFAATCYSKSCNISLHFTASNKIHEQKNYESTFTTLLTLRLLMSYIYIYIYGAPSKARNANVVYIWIYVWQR